MAAEVSQYSLQYAAKKAKSQKGTMTLRWVARRINIKSRRKGVTEGGAEMNRYQAMMVSS